MTSHEPDIDVAIRQAKRFGVALLYGIAAVAGLAIAWSAWHEAISESSDRPLHILLTDEACGELREAKRPDGRAPATPIMPCSFTGYVFDTDVKGLHAIFGVSENVKGQCMLLSGGMIDVSKSYTDHDYPPMRAMPAKCRKANVIESNTN